jgi:hypothetical protein
MIISINDNVNHLSKNKIKDGLDEIQIDNAKLIQSQKK